MRPDTGQQKRLGRYHVAEYIGSGPCGEIHEATLDGEGRTYALKRFHNNYVSDSLVASGVATAARQYASLSHPRIARLHAFVTVDEHTLAAVELIDGISLDLLLDANLPIGAWAKLIVQLGRGVGYAHGRGLCHLGISPTNIICDPSGSISVTDFGFLAPGLANRRGLNLGERLGYLAPEQLEGKRSSPASDVYSMGTIAYQLMTGSMPFGDLRGEELEKAILKSPIPEADLPKPFQKLVHRALARSPFERFSDAGAMADAMEAALRAVPSPGSLSDIGKFVFEQLGTGTEGENIVKGFNDLPTVIPGVSEPIAPVAVAESRIPITEIEVSPTRPYSTQIPNEIVNEMPISSGTPDVLLGPAGSGPTSSGQLFIGGNAHSKSETEEGNNEFSADLPENKTVVTGEQDADPRQAVRDFSINLADGVPSDTGEPLSESGPTVGDFSINVADGVPSDTGEPLSESGPTVGDFSLNFADDESSDAGEQVSALGSSVDESLVPALATSSVAQRLPLQRAPTEGMSDASEAAANGSVDFPSIEDEPTEGSVARELGMSEEPAEIVIEAAHQELVAPAPIPPGMDEHNPQIFQQERQAKGSWLKYAVLGVVLASSGFWSYKLFSDGEASSVSLSDSAGKDARGGATASKPVANSDADMAKLGKKDAAQALAQSADAATIVARGPADASIEVPADAGPVATAVTTPDASVAVAVVSLDAGSDTAPPADGDKLEISSIPKGASVYIDGTPVGKTPVSIDASMDRHRLALLLPGYNLHTDDIDGSGSMKIELSEVTPGGGPGGIKVRCRKKNRYYVFVDGRATGELCPSERIGVSKGKHMVEIYDPVSDSRREYKAVVTGTRASLRVRVD